MVELFLKGQGINVGEDHCLQGVEHRCIAPGNLYLLRNEVGVETYDYLYSHCFINKTKYYRILLYEWFYVIKEGGYIIIEFEDNEIMDYECLKKELSTLVLYSNKHKIVEECVVDKKRKLVIQKTKSVKRDTDEIDQWTFGIVTNGKRKDFIEKAINSIRNLNIPQYEIILCGTYHGEVRQDMRYIHFAEKDDRGWITKKKNIVCENSKYENIVVIHDRICFDKNWFDGMKRYGNYFDVLSCPVMFYLKYGRVISTNWDTVGKNFTLDDDNKLFHSNGSIEIDDWDNNAIISGPLIVLKKHIWSIGKWNENLFWGDAEDIEYSHRQSRRGIMLRLNPYSKVHAMSISGVIYKSRYEKDTQKLGRFYCELPVILTFTLKTLDIIGFRRNKKIVQFFIKKIKKFYNASSWKEELTK